MEINLTNWADGKFAFKVNSLAELQLLGLATGCKLDTSVLELPAVVARRNGRLFGFSLGRAGKPDLQMPVIDMADMGKDVNTQEDARDFDKISAFLDGAVSLHLKSVQDACALINELKERGLRKLANAIELNLLSNFVRCYISYTYLGIRIKSHPFGMPAPIEFDASEIAATKSTQKGAQYPLEDKSAEEIIAMMSKEKRREVYELLKEHMAETCKSEIFNF